MSFDVHAPLILASGSPRRRELLQSLGVSFEVHPADIDESALPNENPTEYVKRLAIQKAARVSVLKPGRWVLAADTSVVLGNVILGKPSNALEAESMLRQLSGKSHQVLTAVALAGRSENHVVVETAVHFHPLTEEQIEWYVQTREPMDKAGSYAVQGLGALFIRGIEGSPSCVVGLPVAETVRLLVNAGFPVAWKKTA